MPSVRKRPNMIRRKVVKHHELFFVQFGIAVLSCVQTRTAMTESVSLCTPMKS
jgi:hypothetical protein